MSHAIILESLYLKGNKNQDVANAISIAVDILKDFLAVLQAGNYASLYSFGLFLLLLLQIGQFLHAYLFSL